MNRGLHKTANMMKSESKQVRNGPGVKRTSTRANRSTASAQMGRASGMIGKNLKGPGL